MNINKILYPILLLLVVLSSCDYESPLDKEQYKKTLYLIGASSNLAVSYTHLTLPTKLEV